MTMSNLLWYTISEGNYVSMSFEKYSK